MSYDNWKLTEPTDPFNEQQPDLIPCGCQDPDCLIKDGDPSNVRIGRYLYSESCANENPVIAADRDRAFRHDIARDDMNRSRR